jgi:hypothetical protein
VKRRKLAELQAAYAALLGESGGGGGDDGGEGGDEGGGGGGGGGGERTLCMWDVESGEPVPLGGPSLCLCLSLPPSLS